VSKGFAVVNTSPLIYLARSGHLDLLRIAHEPVVVPEAVVQEIKQGSQFDKAMDAINSHAWLKIVPDGPIPKVVTDRDLGPGESAVIAYGLARPGMTVIVDDRAARRLATSLGLPLRGTLGLVLLAKRDGRIAAARPIVMQLVDAGMFLSSDVLDQALLLVGE